MTLVTQLPASSTKAFSSCCTVRTSPLSSAPMFMTMSSSSAPSLHGVAGLRRLGAPVGGAAGEGDRGGGVHTGPGDLLDDDGEPVRRRGVERRTVVGDRLLAARPDVGLGGPFEEDRMVEVLAERPRVDGGEIEHVALLFVGPLYLPEKLVERICGADVDLDVPRRGASTPRRRLRGTGPGRVRRPGAGRRRRRAPTRHRTPRCRRAGPSAPDGAPGGRPGRGRRTAAGRREAPGARRAPRVPR